MKQITKRRFTSPLTAGLFFGFLSVGLLILTFNLPLSRTYIDFSSATALLFCVLASVYFVDMIAGAENFYRLFVASYVTFCIAIGGMWGYLNLVKGDAQAQWLTLLSGGAVVCFIAAFLANLLRRQKST